MGRGVTLLLAAMCAALLAASGAAVAATVSCAAGAASCNGTAKADTLVGTAGADTIFARAGDDVVRAGAGDDTVWGGGGDDTVRGGDGDDALSVRDGVAGNDFAACGAGSGDTAFADSRDEMDDVSCETVKYPAEATGVLQRIEIAPYDYGTHHVRDEATGTFYALEAESLDLDAYRGRRVAIGGMAKDWNELFGPPLMTVTSLEER